MKMKGTMNVILHISQNMRQAARNTILFGDHGLADLCENAGHIMHMFLLQVLSHEHDH